MDGFLLDLKYAARSLGRAKGFAASVLLTFALCIAANTALFAIVDSVVLKPLPIPDAHSILLMANQYPKAGVIGINSSSCGKGSNSFWWAWLWDCSAPLSMQKAVASEIYGVRPLDPLVLTTVMAWLVAVALAACALPARRAMQDNPYRRAAQRIALVITPGPEAEAKDDTALVEVQAMLRTAFKNWTMYFQTR